MTRRIVVALLTVCALLVVACGQKDSAKNKAATDNVDKGGGGSSNTQAPSATTPGKNGGPDSSVGVTPTEIRIGIHAPVTGAGAPPESFQNYYDLYFKNLGPAINGRSVKVFLEDDKYNPSGAQAACKKLVQVDKVFLIIGAAGADQISACAKYANDAKVPYFSEGIARKGFDNLDYYFATTLTYGDQGKLLAQYIKNVVKKTKVAMVRANTANFDEAHTGFVDGAKKEGLDVVKDITIPKDASGPEAQSAAVQLCGSGEKPEVVYPLISPAIFLQMAAAVKSQNCTVRWAGIGNTMAINLVAQVACGSNTLDGGASFFSSFSGIDKIPDIDPEFATAAEKNNAKPNDDIGWGLWGAERATATLLKAVGKDLTRQNLVKAIEGKKFKAEAMPATDFTKSHFGGTAVHVLKVDCAATPPQWKTEFAFKSSF